MKNLRKKAIMKTLKAAFLTATVLTVLLTAIGDAYAEKSTVCVIPEVNLNREKDPTGLSEANPIDNSDYPVVRSIPTENVAEKEDYKVSSCITHEESEEPQRALGMPDEPDVSRYSKTTYFYVGPNGRITISPSSPPTKSSNDDTSHGTLEGYEIFGYESQQDDGPLHPGVDLIFDDIWTVPSSPIGGESATIYFRVKNNGTTGTGITFRNYFYVGGMGPWYGDNNGLGAGATFTWQISLTLSAGLYELKAIADVNNNVAETDETNNEYTEYITWQGPDLVFIDIWTNPDPPVGGQNVTINWKLKNQGTRDAVGDFTNHFYIDGLFYGSGVNHGLSAGGEFTWWAADVNLTIGWHHIAAVADVYHNIAETDETNNERYENIEWKGPDLIFEDICFSAVSLTAGQPFTLNWRLKNQGEADAVGDFTNKFYIDGVYRYVGVNHGLGAGGAFTWWAANVWLTPGWHNITAVADVNGDIDETVETNNERIELFYVHKATWTILVYLDGDNNLEGWMINSFLQMAQVGSSSHISIVVQMDRSPGGNWGDDTRYDDWTDCKRFFVKTGTTPTTANALQSLGEVNMGDDDTLIDFATWAINRFQADHYLLIPQDHGGTWVGCCWDDTNAGDRLDSTELKNALSSIKGTLGGNLDVIWFNDCLMNSIEVATQVYPYADYMAGSETVSWTGTWDYNPIITALRNNPTMTPQTLAINITDLGTPRDDPTIRSQSISSIDLSKLADLVNTVNSFSKKLKNNLYQYRTQIETARSESDWYEGPYGGQTQRLIDLYQFAYKIKYYVPDSTIDSLADSIMNKIGPSGGAIGKVVMKEDHSASASFCHGIGIYFPSVYSNYSSSYTDGTDFTANTQWDEFLQWYYNVSKPCLVIRGVDNKIYYRVREEGSWIGLSSVPGSTNDAPVAAVLANELHIAVLGTDGKIYHGYVDLSTSTWSGWTIVPGATPSPPALAAYGNRLYLLVRGMNNRIYIKYLEAGFWSTWYPFPTGLTCDSPAAVGYNNKIYVVVRGTTGGLYYAFIDIPTWSYSGWSSIPGDTPSRPALTTDDSYLYLVVRGNNDCIYYNIFKGAWLGWTKVPGQTHIGPATACFEGKLNIVVRGVPSGLYHGTLDLLTLNWLGWTSIPGDTPSQPALTRPC
jgi:hypothetical protein